MTRVGAELGDHTVEIRPEVNILSVLQHLNYRPWYALAEFVDNAVASFLEFHDQRNSKPELIPLRVDIFVTADNGGRIYIEDNAYGIALRDFPRAFRAAEVPPNRQGLSEFGMGMKSAATWFAKEWTVSTSTLNDDVERSVTFNLERIIRERSERISVSERSAAPELHFTRIELRDLNHVPKGRTMTKIKKHLASMYRRFLRAGVLELYVDEERIKFDEVAVLETAAISNESDGVVRWQKDGIDIELAPDIRVKGFAALRAKGSTSEAGFALFRRGRLIEGSFEDAYRPVEVFGRSNSYTFQRLFGEFSIDGLGVSHTKDGFQWGDYEEVFLNKLNEELRSGGLDLLAQAEKYRAKSPTENESELTARVVEAVAVSLENSLPDVMSQATIPGLAQNHVEDSLAVVQGLGYTRTLRIRTEQGLWIVDIEALSGQASSDWLQVSTALATEDPSTGESSSHVEIRINFEHPYTRRHIGANGEGIEVLVSLASSIAIAIALGKRGGARAQFVLTFLNAILRGTYSDVSSEGAISR